MRVRRSDLDALVGAGSANRPKSEFGAEVDEGSVTAWATFGAAMAEATDAMERGERRDLIQTLDAVTEVTSDLVRALRADETRG